MKKTIVNKNVRGLPTALRNGPFPPNHIGWTSDSHRIAIGWTFYRMGSVPNFSNRWKLFFKDYINVYNIFECFMHTLFCFYYVVLYIFRC